MAKDKDGKLTYQMVSPGEAWMNHVNNELNAKAVTPAYLEPNPDKGAGVSKIDKRIQELAQQPDKTAIDQARGKMLEKAHKKVEKDMGISR